MISKVTFLLIIAMSASGVLAADKTAGKATIYSDKFQGKKTATGTTYRKEEVSVASNKLPLGSKVKIRNKANGKVITAKVNDKMGKNSKAVVDLSKGAAHKLGANGTAQVEAKVVSKPSK